MKFFKNRNCLNTSLCLGRPVTRRRVFKKESLCLVTLHHLRILFLAPHQMFTSNLVLQATVTPASSLQEVIFIAGVTGLFSSVSVLNMVKTFPKNKLYHKQGKKQTWDFLAVWWFRVSHCRGAWFQSLVGELRSHMPKFGNLFT